MDTVAFNKKLYQIVMIQYVVLSVETAILKTETMSTIIYLVLCTYNSYLFVILIKNMYKNVGWFGRSLMSTAG